MRAFKALVRNAFRKNGNGGGQASLATAAALLLAFVALFSMGAGAVKGNIDVQGPVILDSVAIVMGDIRSQSLQISNGAAVEGMCSQIYSPITPSDFFGSFDK